MGRAGGHTGELRSGFGALVPGGVKLQPVRAQSPSASSKPWACPQTGMQSHLPAGSGEGQMEAQRKAPRPPAVPPLLFPSNDSVDLHPSAKDARATADHTRNFLVRASCRLQLEPGKEYLIMGLDGATYDLKGE